MASVRKRASAEYEYKSVKTDDDWELVDSGAKADAQKAQKGDGQESASATPAEAKHEPEEHKPKDAVLSNFDQVHWVETVPASDGCYEISLLDTAAALRVPARTTLVEFMKLAEADDLCGEAGQLLCDRCPLRDLVELKFTCRGVRYRMGIRGHRHVSLREYCSSSHVGPAVDEPMLAPFDTLAQLRKLEAWLDKRNWSPTVVRYTDTRRRMCCAFKFIARRRCRVSMQRQRPVPDAWNSCSDYFDIVEKELATATHGPSGISGNHGPIGSDKLTQDHCELWRLMLRTGIELLSASAARSDEHKKTTAGDCKEEKGDMTDVASAKPVEAKPAAVVVDRKGTFDQVYIVGTIPEPQGVYAIRFLDGQLRLPAASSLLQFMRQAEAQDLCGELGQLFPDCMMLSNLLELKFTRRGVLYRLCIHGHNDWSFCGLFCCGGTPPEVDEPLLAPFDTLSELRAFEAELDKQKWQLFELRSDDTRARLGCALKFIARRRCRVSMQRPVPAAWHSCSDYFDAVDKEVATAWRGPAGISGNNGPIGSRRLTAEHCALWRCMLRTGIDLLQSTDESLAVGEQKTQDAATAEKPA